MDNISLKTQLKTIQKINSSVFKAHTIDEAIKNGLKEILANLNIEYASIWYQDVRGDKKLHPYYWIAPVDLTTKSYAIGEGIVGEVFSTRKAIRILDYKKGSDARLDADYEGIDISSVVCVPLSDDEDNIGCIQFVNADARHKITEDEAEICEILCLMSTLALGEKGLFPDYSWKDKKPIMRVRDIYKEFQNGDILTKVLKGMNLDVYEGEFLVILGESGCGKSTFLNILGGLDFATSGKCYYYDEEITSYSHIQLTKYRRDNIGFIFQNYNLMSNLTAKQNLDLIGELVKEPMDSMEALKLVGLDDKCNNYPFQLSGGQQQRVSIARALVKKPKIIFADEPTAAIDYATSIEVLEVLESVMQTGTTLVVVTHNEEVARMADRVIRMRSGKIHEVTINKHPAKARELVW